MSTVDRHAVCAPFPATGDSRRVIDLDAFAGNALHRLPHVLRILLEDALADFADPDAARSAEALLDRAHGRRAEGEITFRPGRILMHDTTSVPAFVDIAALRDRVAALGGDPGVLDPALPVHAVIDHSLAVDRFGSPDAAGFNMKMELRRNAERYRFLKWAGQAFGTVTVIPPGTGILHTINMERLATVVRPDPLRPDLVRPDTMIGTDSHTPMIGALGVLGWGVGGLEAEMVMSGLPMSLALPRVWGVRLTGALRPGVLATDLALTVTERLRAHGVTGKFVEFFGPGVSGLGVGARAAVANMAPEYGATTGFFAIDDRTLDYLRANGRSAALIADVEAFARRQGLWHDPGTVPDYDETLEIDLSQVEMSLAGPRRPNDRKTPAEVAQWARGRAPGTAGLPRAAIGIAAITSCTNSADPAMLVAAGLLARNARRAGLKPAPWVKTSFAPGSAKAVGWLERAGVMSDLEALGFGLVGIGCTTCIGNSGPLLPEVEAAIEQGGADVAAVLSGNRNFPRRVHSLIENAFLCSPPLVVALALAGTLDVDLLHGPFGVSADGTGITLSNLWPGEEEIAAALSDALAGAAADVSVTAQPGWEDLEVDAAQLFRWDPASTYLRPPPFARTARALDADRIVAQPLLVLGDDMTTDHISPAGAIPKDGLAARYLLDAGCDPRDFNVFAARRGNFEVMARGAFTHPSAVNLLCPSAPPGHSLANADAAPEPVFDVAAAKMAAGLDLVILAGHRYGAGSSRDWAAKAPALLGVRAVLASSFERIHRSNLIGMGIVPVQLPDGVTPESLGLGPEDRVEIPTAALGPHSDVAVSISHADGRETRFTARAMIETAQESSLLRIGGVLPFMLDRALRQSKTRKVV